jgi:arylformamidase
VQLDAEKALDISVPIHPGMLHWGRRPEIEIVESRSAGQPSNVSRWRIGAHTGTHIDAPAHFIDGGHTVDQLDLTALIGPARVLDLTGVRHTITAADLERAGLGDEGRVLLKTSNSATVLRSPWKSPAWVGLAPDGAALLVEAGVRLAAIDYLSIEDIDHTTHWETHQLLCGAGVLILEVADLLHAEPGVYWQISQPIPLQGAEAAPAPTLLFPLSGPPASGLTSTEAPARNEPGASARRREDAGLRPANAERSEAIQHRTMFAPTSSTRRRSSSSRCSWPIPSATRSG